MNPGLLQQRFRRVLHNGCATMGTVGPTGSLRPTGRQILADQFFAEDTVDGRWSNVVFQRLSAKDVVFRRIDFKYTQFDTCYLRRCRFEDCDFTGSRFSKCMLSGSIFEGCSFEYANFEA